VARTHIPEHRIGSLEPELGLDVVLEKLKDEVANIGYVFEVLANFLRSFRVESNRTLRSTRHSRNVAHTEACEVSDLLIVEVVALPEMQAITGYGAKRLGFVMASLPRLAVILRNRIQ
jgi:hypothetical protein